MIVIGTISTRSPGLNAGTWPPAGAAGLALACAAAAGTPASMNPRMSLLVTRPLMPVPLTRLMSTLCSRAMRRTSGDVRCLLPASGSRAPASV
jgi:hypothetical protein